MYTSLFKCLPIQIFLLLVQALSLQQNPGYVKNQAKASDLPFYDIFVYKKFIYRKFLMTSFHVSCPSPIKNPGYAYAVDRATRQANEVRGH